MTNNISVISIPPVPISVVSVPVAEITVIAAPLGIQGNTGPMGPRGPMGDIGNPDWNTLINMPPQSIRQEYTNVNLIVKTHNMKKYPTVKLQDTGGTWWSPRTIDYPTIDEVVIGFDTLFSGTLFLS